MHLLSGMPHPCTSTKRGLACSRPSVSGSVRRAAGERGKNEEGIA